MAERRIVEKSGEGIISFISNYSWLDGLSFTGMREKYLEVFDSITVDCLNGDKYKTGKLTPEGKPDPSVFSTEYNREGIQVGTAIGLMVRQPERGKKPHVLFRQFWGVNKRAEILDSLKAKMLFKQYQAIEPEHTNRFSFCPSETKGFITHGRV